jgi:hypothetical protein
MHSRAGNPVPDPAVKKQEEKVGNAMTASLGGRPHPCCHNVVENGEGKGWTVYPIT